MRLYIEKTRLESQNKALDSKIRAMEARMGDMAIRIRDLEEDQKKRIATTTSVFADYGVQSKSDQAEIKALRDIVGTLVGRPTFNAAATATPSFLAVSRLASHSVSDLATSGLTIPPPHMSRLAIPITPSTPRNTAAASTPKIFLRLDKDDSRVDGGRKR